MMDLEDDGWVNIHDDGFLEVVYDGDEKIFSRNHVKNSPAKFFKPNYSDTSQNPHNFVEEEPQFGKHLVPLPTKLLDDEEEVKEIIKLPILINDEPNEARHEVELDQDPIFQAFFNQFVDMKTSSLKMNYGEPELSCIGMETIPFQYEGKSDDHGVNCSSPSKMRKQEVGSWNGKMNIWRWGLSGVGAVGMVAATVCILVFGNGRKQNKKLRIQIYSDNKKMKQGVEQSNETMSTMRGYPLVKAHITYGGYHESF